MSKQQRNVRRTHAAFFAHYGRGPWTCYTCEREVTKIGQNTWDGNIHHLDENVTNDHPSNLVVAHTVCHQRMHPVTDEQRVQISRRLKGRVSPTKGMKFSAEVNAKKSRPGETNPFFGRHHTTETLTRMRTPRRRELCSACGQSYALNWIKRHRDEGKCIEPPT